MSTDTLSTGLTFLLGEADLTQEFDVAYATDKLGGPGDVVLKLTPKKPTAQYEHLVLMLRPTDYSVGESMVVSKQALNHFIFTEVQVNTKIARGRFRFKPPAGAKIIDGSKLGRRP
jgi:outer membrane lipoprotein-sorting protein